jgi:hypothetical protein
MLQVIQTNDIVGSTVELLVVMINVIETQVTYQTRWRPFGIALRALTGPLLLGNLKVLSGALSPWWRLNSSTVPFLLPAYIKLPSGLQQAPIHHGGTPGRFGI